MSYVVISSTEDGCYVTCLEKAEVEKRLKEKYWGNVTIFPCLPMQPHKADELPLGLYILLARVVMPQVVHTATEYKLP